MNTPPVRIGDVLKLGKSVTFRDRSFVGKEKLLTIPADSLVLVRKVDIQDPSKKDSKRPEPCAEIVIVDTKQSALMNYDHMRFIFKNELGIIAKNILS